jgi:formate dehydrogenase subunit beta
MAKTAKIEVKERNPVASLRDFLKMVLRVGGIEGLLVAQHFPVKGVVMPTLVVDPDKLGDADPLAPAFPINAAKIVSRLTRRPLDGQVGVVLRPCEIRAFVELVKLKQGSLENVLVIGLECLGAYRNLDYPRFVGEDGGEASTLRFYRDIVEGKGAGEEDFDLSPACKACEHPVPGNADLVVGLIGLDPGRSLPLDAKTPKGEAFLERLELSAFEEPRDRGGAVAELVARRISYRNRMFAETGEATGSLEKLTAYLGKCVNCYNCRVACPVCYCKECVFVTDVFDREPSRFLHWAKRKGLLRMPTDTIFYHLTRLAHMSTACVGCGQCSNACPNGIPVMDLFRTIASHTQDAFGYEAGRGLDEDPPLSVFRENEFPEVTGAGD